MKIRYVILGFALTLLALFLFGDPAGSCSFRPVIIDAKPPLVTYDAKFQNELASEMLAMKGKFPRALTVIADYAKLREAERAE